MFNYKFNGTSSFKDLFDTLGITNLTSYKERDGKVIVNVAGFSQSDISVTYDRTDNSVSIECEGDSPFFGDSYSINFNLPIHFTGKPKVSYCNGTIVLSNSDTKEAKAEKLEFDTETLLD